MYARSLKWQTQVVTVASYHHQTMCLWQVEMAPIINLTRKRCSGKCEPARACCWRTMIQKRVMSTSKLIRPCCSTTDSPFVLAAALPTHAKLRSRDQLQQQLHGDHIRAAEQTTQGPHAALPRSLESSVADIEETVRQCSNELRSIMGQCSIELRNTVNLQHQVCQRQYQLIDQCFFYFCHSDSKSAGSSCWMPSNIWMGCVWLRRLSAGGSGWRVRRKFGHGSFGKLCVHRLWATGLCCKLQ